MKAKSIAPKINSAGRNWMLYVDHPDKLTHRQWLAGMAMQAMLSTRNKDDVDTWDEYLSVLPEECYQIADAMLNYEVKGVG